MIDNQDVIRDIYTSDIILSEMEEQMSENVNDRCFQLLEDINSQVSNGKVILSENQIKDLEKSFQEFYFEYAYIQFKRGLELGLSMRHIC